MSYAPFADCDDQKWSEKAEEISHLLSAEHIELWKLREMALSPGGLVTGTFRKRTDTHLVLIIFVKIRKSQPLLYQCQILCEEKHGPNFWESMHKIFSRGAQWRLRHLRNPMVGAIHSLQQPL